MIIIIDGETTGVRSKPALVKNSSHPGYAEFHQFDISNCLASWLMSSLHLGQRLIRI